MSDESIEKSKNFRSGIVAVVGRPNVGKSTLVNALVGENVTITSQHAHTTRTQIRAIDTTESEQIVYVDTPGIHKPRFKISSQLNHAALDALEGVDLIVAVFDGSSKIGSGDRHIAEMLKNRNNVVAVLNKGDAAGSIEKLAEKSLELDEMLPEVNDIFVCSAFTGKNVKLLKKKIIENLQLGPALFDPSTKIDVTDEYLVAEIFRESLIRLLSQELPQEIGVISREDTDRSKVNQRFFEVNILVTRKSHKPIVIGNSGSMLEKCGTQARKRLESIFGVKITLNSKVIVEENWQSNPSYLDSQYIFQSK